MIPPENITYYERYLRSSLQSFGVVLDKHGFIASPFSLEGSEKWRAWLCEALLSALKAVREEDPRAFVRHALHAREMLGRYGGAYVGLPVAHDCAIAIQNHLQDLVSR